MKWDKMTKNKLNIFTDHMEYIGYKFEKVPKEPNTMIGIRDNYPAPTIVSFNGGPILFKSIYDVNPQATKKRKQYLELVNELNKKFKTSTAAGYDDCLVIGALYIGLYDKQKFGSFLDVWHMDGFDALEQEGLENFLK